MLSEADVLFEDFTGFSGTLSWEVLVAELLFISQEHCCFIFVFVC